MEDLSKNEPLVDTASFLKNPAKRRVYKLLQPTLERLLGVRRLNDAYVTAAKHGQDPKTFAEACLREFGVRYKIDEARVEALRKVEGPFVLISNHPFGGLEAIFMVLLMCKVRPDFKVMANFMLERIKEIEGKLILVDPFGLEESKAKNMGPMKEALAYLKNGGFLGVFPSGEVAAYNLRSGKVEEPHWNVNIAKLILKTKATVVPLYFHGTNSMLFHAAGVLNPRLRTGLLIREFVNPTFNELAYQIGEVIPPGKIAHYQDPDSLTAYLKSKLYLLGLRYPQKHRMALRLPRRLTRGPLALNPRVVPVIDAIPPEALNREVESLKAGGHLLLAQKEFDVMVFTAQTAPNLLRELGRQRELTFRAVGEGTGEPLDVSDYDMYYDHLLIWDREKANIVGSYRLGRVDKIMEQLGRKWLYITTSFKIKKTFFETIGPIIECSRAIVTRDYQRSYYALHLLWMGIGQYVVRNPDYKYLMGALSVSNEFHDASKQFMVQYLEENHQAKQLLPYMRARNPFARDFQVIDTYYRNFNIVDINSVQELINHVEQKEIKIPVLMRQYLKLGAKCVEFNVDPAFSNALDIFLLTDLTVADPETMRKYLGDDNYAAYRAHHGLPPLPEPAKAIAAE